MLRILIPALIAAIFLQSCAKKVITGQDSLVIYPSPPDTARIQFLTRISSSHDVTGDRNPFSRLILGEDEDIAINKPYGVAVAGDKIFICDTFIHGLDVIDMKDNSFEQFIPTGKGELKQPINCTVDSLGNVYVADSERKQVVIFDNEGNYTGSFGDPESFKPVDVAVKYGKIWVTNLAQHQVMVFSCDSSHELLSVWPEFDKSNPSSLFSPTNLYISDNKVYVTDFGDFKIKEYTLDGEFITSLGTYGQNPGQFVRPKGLAVDKDENLYVVDAGFENVQIFNPDGNLLMFFGGNYKGPGDMWLPAKVTVDYNHTAYFEKYVDPSYHLKYVILVSNQFGPDKLNIYGAIEPVRPGQKGGLRNLEKKGKRKPPMF